MSGLTPTEPSGGVCIPSPQLALGSTVPVIGRVNHVAAVGVAVTAAGEAVSEAISVGVEVFVSRVKGGLVDRFEGVCTCETELIRRWPLWKYNVRMEDNEFVKERVET